jgi:hypothetical protein
LRAGDVAGERERRIGVAERHPERVREYEIGVEVVVDGADRERVSPLDHRSCSGGVVGRDEIEARFEGAVAVAVGQVGVAVVAGDQEIEERVGVHVAEPHAAIVGDEHARGERDLEAPPRGVKERVVVDAHAAAPRGGEDEQLCAGLLDLRDDAGGDMRRREGTAQPRLDGGHEGRAQLELLDVVERAAVEGDGPSAAEHRVIAEGAARDVRDRRRDDDVVAEAGELAAERGQERAVDPSAQPEEPWGELRCEHHAEVGHARRGQAAERAGDKRYVRPGGGRVQQRLAVEPPVLVEMVERQPVRAVITLVGGDDEVAAAVAVEVGAGRAREARNVELLGELEAEWNGLATDPVALVARPSFGAGAAVGVAQQPTLRARARRAAGIAAPAVGEGGAVAVFPRAGSTMALPQMLRSTRSKSVQPTSATASAAHGAIESKCGARAISLHLDREGVIEGAERDIERDAERSIGWNWLERIDERGRHSQVIGASLLDERRRARAEAIGLDEAGPEGRACCVDDLELGVDVPGERRTAVLEPGPDLGLMCCPASAYTAKTSPSMPDSLGRTIVSGGSTAMGTLGCRSTATFMSLTFWNTGRTMTK